ncbi:SDR family NAD(P)-dependent oxidoreductase [Gryllotalpicola protaetiae]|uniref:SDR family oxidoreductase n=1 Tax=Gryllotalpicola protaetiae TaxID=2419771 RepID=A0A387BT21_9MICO|nr:SDR family oxidoreductase [Gryllotalpicola protaetiae]AYG04097.1 SDR family oxidoreductase [Gryllotalpicola protaetiae]
MTMTENMTGQASVFAHYPSLAGRTAFVSGGATGLGREFVAQLAEQGARVAFCDVDADAGAQLAAETGALFLPVDVTDVAALQAALGEASARLGPIRALVNNAANDTRRPVDDIDVAGWDEGVAVNVRHHFFAAQAVRAGMRAAGGGSIINLGSISAHIDLVELPVYITAKAGIEGLTRTLAREFGGDGIRVNCIIPGWVMTPRQLSHWVGDAERAKIMAAQCLPELLYPADVARLMLWLAADDSRLCTAQSWVVDGGWM